MYDTTNRDIESEPAATPGAAAPWCCAVLALLLGMSLVWLSLRWVGPLAGVGLTGLICFVLVYRLQREAERCQQSAAQLYAAGQRVRQTELLRQAQAQQARHSRAHFLNTAGHELRQPLFALTLYVSALKRHLEPEQAPLAANVKECVDSLNHLITDLLELSKFEAGVTPFTPRDFVVDELIGQAISACGAPSQSAQRRLRSRTSGLTAHTDPVLLRHMLDKLISNALRYAQQGKVLVACRQRQGKMWLEVWDTGVGIAPDQTEVIFEQFRQLDNHAPDARQGSGLGLSYVAQAAALMGLQIRVRSRLARGSLFAIELPLRATSSAATARAPG